MAVTISNTNDAIQLAKNILSQEVDSLDASDKVKVETPSSIKKYTLAHPRGSLLVMYGGSDYVKTDERNNAVLMKRNMVISIVAWIRYFENRMSPAEYVDFVNNSLCGIEIENTRPEHERKIYPIDDELVEEDNGEWKYMIRVGLPTDFLEKSLIQ